MLRRRRDERGYIIPLASLVLVSLLAVSAVVVDLGFWQVEASRIQKAADAAALAGAAALPQGEAVAENRAIEIAAANGFVDGVDGVTVVADARGVDEMRVTVRRDGVERFFSQVVDDSPAEIERGATAKYVLPVPMGSARNYIGTGPQLPGTALENFYLGVYGICSKRDDGDNITPLTQANENGGVFQSCVAGSPSHVRPNPDFDLDGYAFAVKVPDVSGSTPVTIQLFDMPHCPGSSGIDRGSSSEPFDITMTVRAADRADPRQGTIIHQQVYRGSRMGTAPHCIASGLPVTAECPAGVFQGCWSNFVSFTRPGIYYIVLTPEDERTAQHLGNLYGMRAKRGATFTPCSTDPTETVGQAVYDPLCTNVHALDNLGIAARIPSGSPNFYLASVGPEHNGKKMTVNLWDTGEGAAAIEILDPNGNPVTFDWNIRCIDGRYAPCVTGENEPRGGRTGRTNRLDVSGTGPQPNDHFECCSKYNGREIDLTVTLPDDIVASFGARRWWRIRYTASSTISDRTTWRVNIQGDPVRLVPHT